MDKLLFKRLAAFATIGGIMLGALGRLLEPHVRVTRTPTGPIGHILSTSGDILAVIAPIIYIILDRSNLFPKLFPPKKDD
jgi:hypothetical protein